MRKMDKEAVKRIKNINNSLYSMGIAKPRTYIVNASMIIMLVGRNSIKEALVNSDVEEKDVRKHILDSIIEEQKKIWVDYLIGRDADIITNAVAYLLFFELIKEDDVALMRIINQGFNIYDSNKVPANAVNDIDWINELVIKLFLTNKCRTNLLNNDCSDGIFMANAKNNNIADTYIGYSDDETQYMYASIRAYLNSGNTTIIENKDNYYINDTEFDLIYSTFPLGMRTSKRIDLIEDMFKKWKDSTYIKHNKTYTLNMLGLRNAIEQLSENGMLIAFIQDGCLTNETDIEIKQDLIDHNYIDSIIALPTDIIPGLRVNTSLVILKRNRTVDYVKFIDASNKYTSMRRYNQFEEKDILDIVELYTSMEETSEVSFISNKVIIENNYNLSRDRYKKSLLHLNNAKSLGDVCTDIFRGYQTNAKNVDNIAAKDGETTNYYLLNVSDIKNEGYICDTLQPVRIDNPRKYSKYYIEDGDLIITSKNTVIKSAVYEKKDDRNIILTSNLIAIRVNKNAVDPYYLKAFLDSDIGQEILASIQTGTSIKTINPKALEDMKVSIIDEEEMKEIGLKLRDNIQKMISLMKQYEEINQQNKELIKMQFCKTEK